MTGSGSLSAGLLALSLAACGGGGGGGNTGNIGSAGYCATRDPASTPASFDTEEYYSSFGLVQIGARHAYERGAEGCGVTVAVFDTGVYLRDGNGNVLIHPELDGKVVHEHTHSFHQVGNRLPLLSTGNANHGTVVSNIASAKRNGQGVHGVAPGASVVSHAIGTARGDRIYNPISLAGLGGSVVQLVSPFAGLLAANADVINASLEFEGLTHESRYRGVAAVTGSLWQVLAQQDRAAADRAVIVFAAGNANGLSLQGGGVLDAISPSILAGLPYYVPQLRGHVLAAVALGNGDLTGGANVGIASYSNRCGIAKSFCLAAPGNAGSTITVDGNTYTQKTADIGADGVEVFSETLRGTSLAAPMVSGAFAVLKSAFPDMGNHELVARLLTTADKSGIYADSDIYGQGRLDLDAATRPVGGPILRFGDDVYTARSYPAGDAVVLPPGFGDALRVLSGRPVTVYDELNAPFRMPLDRAMGDGRQWERMWPRRQLAGASRHRAFRSILPAGSGHVVSYTDWDGAYRFGGVSWHSVDERTWLAFGAGAAPWWNGMEAAASPYAGREEFFNPYLAMAGQGLSVGRSWRLPAGGWRTQLSFYANPRRLTGLAEAMEQGSVAWQAGLLYRGAGSLPGSAATGGVWRFGLQTGSLEEYRHWLGAEGRNSLDVDRAHTRFIGLSMGRHGRRWAWRIAAYRGRTSASGGGHGLLAGTGGLRSRSVVAGVDRLHVWRPGDRLGIRFFEPLRVDGGRLHFNLPSGRDRYGRLYYDAVSLSATPSGRTRDISIAYTAAPGRGALPAGRWSVRQGVRLEPGQNASAAPRWYSLIAWQLNF